RWRRRSGPTRASILRRCWTESGTGNNWRKKNGKKPKDTRKFCRNVIRPLMMEAVPGFSYYVYFA
ncbi:hypothetical protein, partial [uncultured Acetatifactor sp.]|uniref:hypothetical protein n=1 Tax=uncultured Acetatifactor sp. TaxID=1671927 RepID=UPI00262141A9